MVTKCAICAEMCPTWGAYQMHREIMHQPGVVQPKKGKFLTKIEKAEIVSKGERRIGLQHFLGFNHEV